MLEARRKNGADFTAVKFKGSPHVAHLRHFKEEYRQQVHSFINVNKNVKSVRDTSSSEEDNKQEQRKGFLEDSLQPKFL